MQVLTNRFIFTGLSISLLTVLFAVSGAPGGFEEFRIPIWDILLQLNLCSGLVFLVLGVLETVETPTPDLRTGLQLLGAGFLAFVMASMLTASPMPLSPGIQLFLFALSLACLVAAWTSMALTALRQLDADVQE